MAYDLYWDNVELLLHCDGANNSTVFTDLSKKSRSVQAYGTTKITTSQKVFGESSAYFSASPCNIEVSGVYFSPSASYSSLGCVDITIEFWFFYSSAYNRIVLSTGAAGSGSGSIANNRGGIGVTLLADKSIQIYAGNLSVDGTSGYFSRKTNTLSISDGWHHFVVDIKNNVPSIFLDGMNYLLPNAVYSPSAAITTLTNCKLYSPRNLQFMSIGTYLGVLDTTCNDSCTFYPGILDEIRITKGAARYTANFAPPTEAFPDRGALYKLQGIAKFNNGQPADLVRIYRADTGAAIKTLVPDAQGTYLAEIDYSGEVYASIMKPNYRNLVHGPIVPYGPY